jgi:hypothetical protein
MLNLLLFPLRWLAGLRVFRCRECEGTKEYFADEAWWNCVSCLGTGRVGLSVWWRKMKS